MAGTFEAPGALAKPDSAPEMRALLREREVVVLGVHDVHAAGRDVRARALGEVRGVTHDDLGAARTRRERAQRFVRGVHRAAPISNAPPSFQPPRRKSRRLVSLIRRSYISTYEWVHGAMNSQPGPRKNTPITVSTTAMPSNTLNNTIATLRWRARVSGLRSMYGSSTNTRTAPAGTRIPATSGSKCESSSCRPAKYHGAFSELGSHVRVRQPAQRRGERHAETEHDRARCRVHTAT